MTNVAQIPRNTYSVHAETGRLKQPHAEKICFFVIPLILVIGSASLLTTMGVLGKFSFIGGLGMGALGVSSLGVMVGGILHFLENRRLPSKAKSPEKYKKMLYQESGLVFKATSKEEKTFFEKRYGEVKEDLSIWKNNEKIAEIKVLKRDESSIIWAIQPTFIDV